jgi:hypothetical protein
MFFVHQIHGLSSATAGEFEAALREQWCPSVAREPGMKVVWCARSMPGAISFPEIITLTAVADGPALERYGERVRSGDLASASDALGAVRTHVITRVMTPLKFSPLSFELDQVPIEGPERDGAIYLHDFVPPRIGAQRAYEDAMEKVYMSMPDDELLQIVIWAGLETVAGGGPVPESLNISHVRSAEAETKLLSFEAPRDNKQLGNWMYDALQLRDTWTTRLVRGLRWSPL